MMHAPANIADFALATVLTAVALLSMAVALVVILAVIGWLWSKVRRTATLDADEQWRRHLAGEYPVDPEAWKAGL